MKCYDCGVELPDHDLSCRYRQVPFNNARHPPPAPLPAKRKVGVPRKRRTSKACAYCGKTTGCPPVCPNYRKEQQG